MNRTPVDSVSIAFDDLGPTQSGAGTGTEPAFLLLPGWCTNRSVFRPLVEVLAKHRRTIALDWAGHGETTGASGDFGQEQLVAQALGVIAASGVSSVIPVTISHAGWVGLELRRRLGARVAGLVFLDWIVSEPPPPFLAILAGMQSAQWKQAVEQVFGMWLHGVENREVIRFVREEMGSYPGEMWGRAGREIGAAYAAHGSPLAAAARLAEPVKILHLYGQPDDPGYLAFQQGFAAAHPWFQVHKLTARSHFPTLECPGEIAEALVAFAAKIDAKK